LGRTIAVAAVFGLAWLGLAGSSGAIGATPVEVGVDDNLFVPKRVTTDLFEPHLRWTWDADGSGGGTTKQSHNVVSRDRLFSSQLMNTGSYELDFSAGTFHYFCGIHSGMTGRVSVAPIAVSGTVSAAGRGGLGVTWAQHGADTGDRYDVRFRVGKGRWRIWKRDTRRGHAEFGHNRKPVRLRSNHRYSFEARSQQGKGEGKRSGWSPKLKLRT
jgi:hypothetical protein